MSAEVPEIETILADGEKTEGVTSSDPLSASFQIPILASETRKQSPPDQICAGDEQETTRPPANTAEAARMLPGGPPATPERSVPPAQTNGSPSSWDSSNFDERRSRASLVRSTQALRDFMKGQNTAYKTKYLAARLAIAPRRLNDIVLALEGIGCIKRSGEKIYWDWNSESEAEEKTNERRYNQLVKRLTDATTECELLDQWIAKLKGVKQEIPPYLHAEDVVDALYYPLDDSEPLLAEPNDGPVLQRMQSASSFDPVSYPASATPDKLIVVCTPLGSSVSSTCEKSSQHLGGHTIDALADPKDATNHRLRITTHTKIQASIQALPPQKDVIEVYTLPTEVNHDDGVVASRGVRSLLFDPLALSEQGGEFLVSQEGGFLARGASDFATEWFE